MLAHGMQVHCTLAVRLGGVSLVRFVGGALDGTPNERAILSGLCRSPGCGPLMEVCWRGAPHVAVFTHAPLSNQSVYFLRLLII